MCQINFIQSFNFGKTVPSALLMNLECVVNDIKSQFSAMIDIMNNIVNDKKGHQVVNDSFAHEEYGLLVENRNVSIPLTHNH